MGNNRRVLTKILTGDELLALATTKRVKKCNNDTATKKGYAGYNLSYKLDHIWRCLIHDINFLTKRSELDICGDETS